MTHMTAARASTRPHGRHQRAAEDRVPLLHRLRSLGEVVGRRLDDRRAAGRQGVHPLPERRRSGRRGGRGRTARSGSSSPTVTRAARRSRRADRASPSSSPPIGWRHAAHDSTHEFADAAVRDEHMQGWRYQLSLFGNVVADEVNSGAAGDRRAGSRRGPSPTPRRASARFARIAAADVQFRDRFSMIDGLDDSGPAHRGGAAIHAGTCASSARRRPALPGTRARELEHRGERSIPLGRERLRSACRRAPARGHRLLEFLIGYPPPPP